MFSSLAHAAASMAASSGRQRIVRSAFAVASRLSAGSRRSPSGRIVTSMSSRVASRS